MSGGRLTHLSISAHEQALTRGTLCPAERPEWMHLPMKWVEGFPVFDSARMREDQIEEMIEALERSTGRERAKSVREQVADYVVAYGRLGLRVKEVMDAVGATKPAVLKYLREMVDAGRVTVKEEKTRGTGSRRKRYYLADTQLDDGRTELFYEDDQDDAMALAVKSDRRDGNSDAGVIHHGSAVGGLQCPCGACRYALTRALVDETVSAARRRGETGLKEGVAAFTAERMRYERQLLREMGL